MTVVQAIAALLYDHDTVIVPGLGAFLRHDESAQVNVVANAFQSPRSTLGFDPAQREESRLVIDFLMQSDGLTDEEARQQIAAFVADSYASMREGGAVALEGIGTLALDAAQELVFEPDDTSNFNPDAFGLTDISVASVWDAGRPTDVEVTPCDDSVVTPSPEPPKPSRWWLLIPLLLLLVALVWWFLKSQPAKPEPTPPAPSAPAVTVDSTQHVPEPVTQPVDSVAQPVDSVAQPVDTVEEPAAPIQVVKPAVESKVFIVGGCFSVEQNALNMVLQAREEGCADTFVMRRGSMYFVCYGQYPTAAEAKAALPDIIANYNPKAWILTK